MDGAYSKERALTSDGLGFSIFTYYGQGIVTVVEYPSLLNTRKVPYDVVGHVFGSVIVYAVLVVLKTMSQT